MKKTFIAILVVVFLLSFISFGRNRNNLLKVNNFNRGHSLTKLKQTKKRIKKKRKSLKAKEQGQGNKNKISKKNTKKVDCVYQINN